MKDILKNYYHFSNYQIAQLTFLFKTVFSEISKLLFIGLLFYRELDLFVIAVSAMLLLRISTGGLHCKTYFSCLLASFFYLFLSIRVLPFLAPGRILKAILLAGCMAVNYIIGPVTGDLHAPLSSKHQMAGRLRALCIIFICFIFVWMIPENRYVTVCFWIIVLHTLQLIAAKIRKKGVSEI